MSLFSRIRERRRSRPKQGPRRPLFRRLGRGSFFLRFRQALLWLFWWATVVVWLAGSVYVSTLVPVLSIKGWAILFGSTLAGTGFLVVPTLMWLSSRRSEILDEIDSRLLNQDAEKDSITKDDLSG